MFVDEVEMALKAGDGGSGCMSFRREKYIPKGGPDGGDGGKGGDVVLLCDDNVSDLVDFYYKPHAKAEAGGGGRGAKCHGRNGSDVILRVPPGTIVYERDSGAMVTELMQAGDRRLLLAGGRGGLGNVHFKSSTNRAPRQFTEGKPGQEGVFRLVMKSIADVGLVGFPNGGKSSLINRLTRTQRPVANYPFTTLRPKVGVIEFDDYRTVTVADIPGLIEGAHRNLGLGFRFLRHIERCRVLLLLLDMAGTDDREPTNDYEVLLSELGHFQENLLRIPRLVVANKMDLPSAAENLREFRKKFPDISVRTISCATDQNLDGLKTAIREAVDKSRPMQSE